MIGAVVILGAGLYALSENDGGSAPTDTGAVIVPNLTPQQQAGNVLYDANCAACHGPNASGSDQGPPLVHPIYEPSHHGDIAFQLAARQGVRAHHWKFGNMPAVGNVSDDDVAQITDYVRALQRANGID
ncbi:cytochrome c [Sulfitobacter sp. D35]|uniref:c-type cytochrome n=1 Tax=Sulfitobacter sp. D35 TaxID=3083252 RepID=UPI00296E53F5|nr:cytochrome c [Sulfitobacter sp. D35]MDW4497142.1 cytochrome c [Sulfitobacter sp. D35]